MIPGVPVQAGRRAVALASERPPRALSSAAHDRGADPAGMRGRRVVDADPEPAARDRSVRARPERRR